MYCCLLNEVHMTLLLVNKFELMTYDTIVIVKQNFKDVNEKYDKKSTCNQRNIHSLRCMRCESMDCILMYRPMTLFRKYGSSDQVIWPLYRCCQRRRVHVRREYGRLPLFACRSEFSVQSSIRSLCYRDCERE